MKMIQTSKGLVPDKSQPKLQENITKEQLKKLICYVTEVLKEVRK